MLLAISVAPSLPRHRHSGARCFSAMKRTSREQDSPSPGWRPLNQPHAAACRDESARARKPARGQPVRLLLGLTPGPVTPPLRADSSVSRLSRTRRSGRCSSMNGRPGRLFVLSRWILKRWAAGARPGARRAGSEDRTSVDFVHFASSTCYVLIRDKFCPRVRASTRTAEALGRSARAAPDFPRTRQDAQRGPLAVGRPRHRRDTAGDADCGRADARSPKATEPPTFADAADGSELTLRGGLVERANAAIEHVARLSRVSAPVRANAPGCAAPTAGSSSKLRLPSS